MTHSSFCGTRSIVVTFSANSFQHAARLRPAAYNMDPIPRQLPPHVGGVTAVTVAAWCALAHAVVRKSAATSSNFDSPLCETAATSLDQWALQRCQVIPPLGVLVGVRSRLRAGPVDPVGNRGWQKEQLGNASKLFMKLFHTPHARSPHPIWSSLQGSTSALCT